MLDMILCALAAGLSHVELPRRSTAGVAGPVSRDDPRSTGRRCAAGCDSCVECCPTGALQVGPGPQPLRLDLGRCLFCRECERACPERAIEFSRDYRLAASRREQLIVTNGTGSGLIRIDGELQMCPWPFAAAETGQRGGCNAGEADTNVLNTVGWDLSRFGIQFVASPRHADGLLITGPVTENMRLVLEKTYLAVPAPKIVVAVGSVPSAAAPTLTIRRSTMVPGP